MDELSEMYERQKRFLTEILGTDKFEHLHAELTEKYLLRLHGELVEVFDASKLKETKPVLSFEEKEHQLEEMIDCFKYLLNLFIVNEHKPEDIIRKFNEKSSVVEKRKK
ncbi:MAG: hypothetical protein WC438_06280 [Candidatus Pacearchaeota archaeon]